MTEQTSTDEQRTCEECGTELQQVQLEFVEADFSEGRMGTPIARDVCPNPECSRHQAETASAQSVGDRPVERENLPGSMGRDHGGG